MDEIMNTAPPEHTPSEEEIAEWEREREEREAAKLAPAQRAAQQRRESAAIIAEHDDMLADMLFEMTMNDLGGEV